ncbi:MAG TPA: hypothetical protein VGF15_07510 [Solirubrobacteraceae bacterium]
MTESTAKISGSRDAVASPFAVGGCKSLAFKPKFTVSTNGHTSRLDGASLDAKLSYPAGSMGNATNIARVKVSLPKILPSQLKTLQKACPAATFDKDPAACPAGSIVGITRATTPLLPVGLSGPVYSRAALRPRRPLIVVLQGDGVRVDLTGATFVNKAGITSSTVAPSPTLHNRSSWTASRHARGRGCSRARRGRRVFRELCNHSGPRDVEDHIGSGVVSFEDTAGSIR